MGGSTQRMINGYVTVNNKLVLCGSDMNGYDTTL